MTLHNNEPSQAFGLHRVLMIAAAFPPSGGPGVQRSVKFAKYLPRFGWLATVWTVEQVDDLPQDPTLLHDLPTEVVIHRFGKGNLLRSLRGSLRSLTAGGWVPSRLASAIDWRITSRLAQRHLPDDFAGWARASLRRVCRLVEQEKIDVIYSTYSPASNHLLALEVQQETGLPWVADFRDLWTDDPGYRETSPPRRRAHRALEQRILEQADAVVGVSEAQTAMLADRVPGHTSKFVTITNGFDPDDFAASRSGGSKDRDRFVLVHVGRFDHRRMTPALWAGLRRWVDRLGEPRNRFTLRLVGHVGGDARARIEAAGLSYQLSGYQTHSQAIAEMCRADALLLIMGTGQNAETVIPAKIFEYLASQRPVLAVGPSPGISQRLVESCAAGLTAALDEHEIADALEKLYRAWASGKPLHGCPGAHLERFSRVPLTGALASVFQGVSGGPPRFGNRLPAPVELCMS